MKKIITIEKDIITHYDSFELMFQALSEQGLIIESLEDGVIKGNKGEDKVEICFGEFISEGTKQVVVEDISKYRDVLRESVTLLKKQGLIEKPQLEKLAAQFAFLKKEEKETKKGN